MSGLLLYLNERGNKMEAVEIDGERLLCLYKLAARCLKLERMKAEREEDHDKRREVNQSMNTLKGWIAHDLDRTAATAITLQYFTK